MTKETEYLLARYAEEEAVARAADIEQGDPTWAVHGPVVLSSPRAFRVRSSRDMVPVALVQDVDDDDGPTGVLDAEAVATHVALHDPARVLADIAAKRKIIELHDSWPILVDQPEPPSAIGSALDGTLAMSVSTRMVWLTTQEYRKRFGDEPPTAPMITALLQPYAGREDFDPMWATSPEHEHQWIDTCTWEDAVPDVHRWKCHGCGAGKVSS